MRFPLFIALLICAAGLVSLVRMPQDIDPPDVAHAETIVALLPGVAPDKLDRLVTRPVERILNEIPGIRNVGAQTTDTISSVTFDLEKGADRGGTLGIVRDRLAQLRSAIQLEAPLLVGPALETDSGGVRSGLILLAPAGDGQKIEPARKAASDLVRKFRAHETVASAEISHDQPRAVVIRYEDEDLARAGLTPPQLADFIRANNQQFPGGFLSENNQLFSVDIGRAISDIESLEDLPVRDPRDGSLTLLGDLCSISLEPIDPNIGGVYLDERPAVGITFTKSDAATWDEMDAVLDSVLKSAPETVQAELILYRGSVTRDLIRSSSWTVVFSILAVLICVTVGLGFRAGVAASVAIATTLLGSVFILHLMAFTWNVVSLAALAIGIGLLIDNHIVILHHVARWRSKNPTKPFRPHELCLRELSQPLLIAAATTALGFLPAWLLRGDPAGYVSSLFPVITTLLVVSLMVGCTLTPGLAPLSLNLRRFDRITQSAIRGNRKSMNRKWIPILSSGIFVSVAVFLFAFSAAYRSEAIPKVPTGISLQSGGEGSKFVAGLPVASFHTFGPPVVFRGMHPHLPEAGRRSFLVNDPSENEISAIPTNPTPVAVRIFTEGDDITSLQKDFENLGPRVREWEESSQFRVIPDLEVAAEQKISTSEIALGTLAASSGIPVGFLTAAESQFPVLLKVDTNETDLTDRLEEAFVHPQEGGNPVPLSDLTDIKKSQIPSVISRWNGAEVAYAIENNPTGNGPIHDEKFLLDRISASAPELKIEPIGEYAESNKATRKVMRIAFPVGLVMLLLLLLQARSAGGATIILLSLLPAFCGAAIACAMFGFGVIPLLGTIALIGFAVNNSIVLISRLRAEDAKESDHIVEVVASRLVPITLSIACAIVGLIPLLFSNNPLWSPFAIPLIIGLMLHWCGMWGWIVPWYWKRLMT